MPPCAEQNQGRVTRSVSWLRRLGPGLVTGASDDDPSGIATYSKAGAQFQFALLWTILFTLPLMASIQEICARLGRITGRGLAGNLRRHYSPAVLYPIVLLLVVANIFNLGADLGAMGDAAAILIGGPSALYAALFAVLCVLLEVFACYEKYSNYLKFLTLVLFCYVVTAVIVKIPWTTALLATIVPTLSWDPQYLAMLVAVFGTTISPYLFFWQASQETAEIKTHDDQSPLTEEPQQARVQFARIRLDTYVGMFLSNVIAYFIMLVAAATLHAQGKEVETARDAALALEPLAGRFAFALFSLGIIGTGLLAVPVLAGSAAYAVGEALHWPTGLERKPYQAKGFYGVLAVATLLGLALNNIIGLDPIKALFWSAVLNGIVAVPLMVVIMLMIANPQVIGKFAGVSKPLRWLGWVATLVMALAVVGLFATWNQ